MRWELPCVVVLCACGGGESQPAAKTYPQLAGTWYPGDFHVHATGASNDTGGDSFPADIAAVARERGLFFVVLTDHSNATGSDVTTTDEDPALFNMGPEFPYTDECAALSVAGELLLIDGNEISPIAAGDPPIDRTGHIGCVPEDLETFDTSGAFIDRPRGDVTGGDALAQALARGCFAVLNHPYALPHISYDWSSFDYDAMEVFNGTLGFDGLDLVGYHAWRCDLVAGRSVAAVGGSDCHRVHTEPPGLAIHPALGYPTTAVRASEPTWPAIMAGLRSGDTAIYEGDSRLFIDSYDDATTLATGGAIRMLRVHGRLDAIPGPGTLTVTRATACNDPRPGSDPPTLVDDVLLEKEINAGALINEEIAIDGEPGVYNAILRAAGGHYSAISRAIVIDGS